MNYECSRCGSTEFGIYQDNKALIVYCHNCLKTAIRNEGGRCYIKARLSDQENISIG